MRKIRKLLSFCLAIFIIFTNIAPAFADDSEQYDSDIFSEYEQSNESDQDFNESDQDSNSDIEEISNYDDRSQEDDVIQIKIKNQQRPNGYVKLSFVGSDNVKPKTERAYYIKRGSGIKIGDQRIEKPDVIERVGYKFRGWDKDDETIIDDADIVVTSRSVALDNVIDNTDGSKEKPKGYVEVKFSSEDESKLFLVPKGRVLYVNPTKKVNLLNFLPLVHRLVGAPSNKISYIWSKNIEAIRRYCHDIEIKAKCYEDKYKISEKEYQDKIKYWENVIENNKNNERLKKYGEEHLKATKEKYKKVSLIMEHGTFYPYSEKDENFTKLVYYVEKDRPVSFDVMNILPDTGYEFLGWSSDIKARKRYREDTEIRAIFNKIPDIIPETSSDGFKLDKEDGYVEVEFKKADHMSLEGETKYFVNPNAGVRISDIPEPTVKVDKGYTFDAFEIQDGEDDQIITKDSYLVPTIEEDPDSPGEINKDSKPPIPAYDPPCPIDQEEPDELPVEETKVLASAKFHGLKGKKFEFQKIYPQGVSLELKGQIKLDNNQTEDLSEEQVLLNPTTRRGKVTGTFDFGMVNKAFFLVPKNTGEKYADLYFNQSQTDFGKILEKHTPPIINDEEKTTTYPVDIYQTQNTYLKFNTLDKDNNPVENPTFGKFTYKIGKIIGVAVENIPQSKEKFDAYDADFVKFDNKEKFDGTNKPEISLKEATDGGFIYDANDANDDFAYKILKTKQDSLSDPLEVTLVKKQKVIKGNDRPTIKDENGKYIPDDDYVKVDFKTGAHSKIEGDNPVYWVLKDVNLGSKIKAPKVKTEFGYGFIGWYWYENKNQKYSKDISHEAKVNKIKSYKYSTYSGDTTTNSISLYDPSGVYLVGLVDEYGIYKEEQLKGYIDFENIPKKARVSLPNDVIIKNSRKVKTRELEVYLEMRVDNSFGDDILKSPEKKLVRETTLFCNDTINNPDWRCIRYTIQNQNKKGEVTPKEKETLRYAALKKEEIYEAVKDGEFSYNSDVPEQNKSGENALHRVVKGENLLNPDKVKEFNISDEDYKKLDFSKLGEQEVPVTITYLDNSKSTVNVKIKIKENVPTGIIDNNYRMPKILLLAGVIGVFVSVINFRKKFLKNYE